MEVEVFTLLELTTAMMSNTPVKIVLWEGRVITGELYDGAEKANVSSNTSFITKKGLYQTPQELMEGGLKTVLAKLLDRGENAITETERDGDKPRKILWRITKAE